MVRLLHDQRPVARDEGEAHPPASANHRPSLATPRRHARRRRTAQHLHRDPVPPAQTFQRPRQRPRPSILLCSNRRYCAAPVVPIFWVAIQARRGHPERRVEVLLRSTSRRERRGYRSERPIPFSLLTQFQEFELSQLVGERLCGHCNVAVGLGLNIGLVLCRMLAEEINHLLPRPMFVMHACV